MSSKQQQILELDPPSDLVFKGPFSGVVTTTLTLRNPSNEKVGFKVKTTAPKQYCVRPNSGIVAPHAESVVSVMLQPTEESSDRSKHKFMVQSMCLEGDVPLDELDATMKAAGKNRLMDSKLKCVFETEDENSPKQTGLSSNEETPVTPVAPSARSNSTSNSETTSLNTPEEPGPSSQPTAGSTPSHSSTSQPFQKEQTESEVRMLRERLKSLTEENQSLKSETDRLKQQFLTRTTTVNKQRQSLEPKNQSSSLNLVAVLLILVAVVLGYFVGTYTS